MKTTLLLLAALSGILHAQGPLAPPAGPAPTMKSLDQIEPLTPISSVPYTISQPGSYYFTSNLQFTAGAGDAITISANGHVKLDLMGFTLSSSAAVTGFGIWISHLHVGSVAVCNGSIEGNSTVALSGDPVTWSVSAAGFVYGIAAGNSKNSSFKDLSISGTRTAGLSSGENAKIMNVSCRNSGGTGILASNGSVTNCTASGNGGIGISAIEGSVTNCTASENGGTGISAPDASVTNSSASNNGHIGISASSGSVSNSTASSNGNVGISASQGSVSTSTTTHNGSSGISAYAGNVTDCSASNNGSDGIYASTGSVTNSTASSNASNDISASNAVVAYCRFTTFAMTNSSRTGNFPSP